MACVLGRNSVFIDSMQFMNSSLDKLVKNLSDKDFKYLLGEFGSEYMNSFERFNEEKLTARKYFLSSTKKWKLDIDGKILDGHVSIEDYLTCEKI